MSVSPTPDPAVPSPSGSLWAPFMCTAGAGGIGAAWVTAAGELDVAEASQLASALQDAQQETRLVVLDLRGLRFIDSCGVRVIAGASAAAARAGNRLLLLGVPAWVKRVFALTGAFDDVEIFDLDDRVIHV